MNDYHITKYTKEQAKTLGVIVTPSKTKYKKLDVYTTDGIYICSCGDNRYADYPTYILTKGKAYADEKRRLYRIRHQNDVLKVGTPAYYAMYLLW